MKENILFICSIKMCCNIPKMAAGPLDRVSKKWKTENSHSHEEEI